MMVRNIINEFAKTGHLKYPDVAKRSKEKARQIKDLPSPQDEIAAELAVFAEHPCDEYTVSWIKDSNMPSWIVAAQLHPSPKYLDSLCKILECDADWIWQEGIVDILYELKNEKSIPSLEKALAYRPPSDPTREIGIKILETLCYIGTSKARQIVEDYLNSPSTDDDFRERAATFVKGNNSFID